MLLVLFCLFVFVLKSMFISGVPILMSSVRPADVHFQTTSSADLSFFFPRACCSLVFEFVIALLVLDTLFSLHVPPSVWSQPEYHSSMKIQ